MLSKAYLELGKTSRMEPNHKNKQQFLVDSYFHK